MAAKTFHKQLPAYLSRLRLTTFDQLADHLLDTQYTRERYPGLARRHRKKDARSDVADAIRRAKGAARLIEKNGRVGGENPRATLLFDSGHDEDILPEHFRVLIQSWAAVARRNMTVLYPPGALDVMAKAIAGLGADPATAELILSWIYLGLTPSESETWQSMSDVYAPKVDCAYWTSVELPYAAAARYRGPATVVEILVPVIRYWLKDDLPPEEQRVFLEFFRRVLTEHRASGTQLQIWVPEAPLPPDKRQGQTG